MGDAEVMGSIVGSTPLEPPDRRGGQYMNSCNKAEGSGNSKYYKFRGLRDDIWIVILQPKHAISVPPPRRHMLTCDGLSKTQVTPSPT